MTAIELKDLYRFVTSKVINFNIIIQIDQNDQNEFSVFFEVFDCPEDHSSIRHQYYQGRGPLSRGMRGIVALRRFGSSNMANYDAFV